VDAVIDVSSNQVDSKPLVDAAKRAGAKLYFPSEFGVDYKPEIFPRLFGGKLAIAQYGRDAGLKVVEVKTGFFADWFINAPVALKIDSDTNVYTQYGTGDYPGAFSFLSDIGRAVASLAHREPGELPNVVRIQSDSLTANQVAAIYEKAKGVKLTVKNIPAEEVLRQAEEANSNGPPGFPTFLSVLVGYIVHPSNPTNFSKHNDNDLVNKDGKLFEWTKFEPAATKVWSAGSSS